MRSPTLADAAAALFPAVPEVQTRRTGGFTTQPGPVRITRESSASRVLGMGDPAGIIYRIDVLPVDDKGREHRARNGGTPRVVTVRGTRMGLLMRVKATETTWHA